MSKITREDALNYHSSGRPGKIEVIPTKPHSTQLDLSLAYSPGVAEPCLAIKDDPENAYKYTAKGNLVAVMSNGTAVLGLGEYRCSSGKACHGRERDCCLRSLQMWMFLILKSTGKMLRALWKWPKPLHQHLGELTWKISKLLNALKLKHG